MEHWNIQALKDRAQAALEQRRGGLGPQKLILLHTGVTAGAALLVTVISLILSMKIEGTGGLGGMATRTMLTTVQTLLQFAQVILVPFWALGYTFATLKLAREKRVETGDLLEGFRRFAPYLRMKLLLGLLYAAIGLACVFIATRIFTVTPWAAPVLDAMAPMANGTAVDEEAVLDAGVAALGQVMPILLTMIGVLFAAVILPVSYQFRLADYALLDDPKLGARAAMRRSRELLYRKTKELFRLDLSFWWYYLGVLLINVLAYGDQILMALGVSFPWSGEISFLIFSVLALAGQFILYWQLRNRVAVTYAVVYEKLLPKKKEET